MGSPLSQGTTVVSTFHPGGVPNKAGVSSNCEMCAGAFPENEDPDVTDVGLHVHQLQRQTPNAHVHHHGDRALSAHHHLLVNLSPGQVTVRRSRELAPSKCFGARGRALAAFSTCAVLSLHACAVLSYQKGCKKEIVYLS